ncbi:MAG: hypothetical protein ABJE95_18770 [Byssovorax sp.]
MTEPGPTPGAARALIALRLLGGAALASCAVRPEPPPATSTLASAPAPLVSPRLTVAPLVDAAPRPGPACPEATTIPGAWPRAAGVARAVAAPPGQLGHLEQTLGEAGAPSRLRFLGAHLFDLLDKLAHEAGPDELDRRRVACAALEAVAASGAPVVRLWGSLKRTGDPAEVALAAELLALTVDENARRARPLRIIVTLLNHQPGYGSPRPEVSLDDQDPRSPWSARRLYLGGGFREPGQGLLADRIAAFAARPALVDSPEILGWELVNELDANRAIRSPADAAALRDGFLVPALDLLAQSFSQPLLFGDLRLPEADYEAFARSIVAALPPPVRARLIWTSHVYATRAIAWSASSLGVQTRKLDRDLELGAALGLPFLLGEVGQLVPGATPPFCGDGTPHDLEQLFTIALTPGHVGSRRGAIEAALFWGEGRCGLIAPSASGARRINIGAGGDSADLGPGEASARDVLTTWRRAPRFLAR